MMVHGEPLYSPPGHRAWAAMPPRHISLWRCQAQARWNKFDDMHPQCPVIRCQNGLECEAGAKSYLQDSDHQNALFTLTDEEFGDVFW